MKAKLYNIVSRCVLDGIEQGSINHNHHRVVREKLSPELTENIHMSIMRELSEYIEFEGDAND